MSHLWSHYIVPRLDAHVPSFSLTTLVLLPLLCARTLLRWADPADVPSPLDPPSPKGNSHSPSPKGNTEVCSDPQGAWAMVAARRVRDRAAVRGGVVVVHGLGEHSGRYDAFCERLASAGFDTFTFDHRGHGIHGLGSGCPEGYFSDYRVLLRDAVDVIDAIVDHEGIGKCGEDGAAPGDGRDAGAAGKGKGKNSARGDGRYRLFLFGHSMGGGLAVHIARGMPGTFSGVCLSAPALQPDPEMATPLLIKVSSFLSGKLPRMPAVKLDASRVSRDPKEVAKYNDDPLVYHGWVRARVGHTLLEMMDTALAGAERDTFPLFVMHGTADGLTRIDGSREYVQKCGSSDKELVEWDGLYHEILNEPEGDKVAERFVQWFVERS